MNWLGRDLGQRVWAMMDDRLWNVGAELIVCSVSVTMRNGMMIRGLLI